MIEITELDNLLNTLEISSLEPHEEYSMNFTNREQSLIWNYIKTLQQKNQLLKQRNTVVEPILFDNVYTGRLMPIWAYCNTKVSQKDNYCKNCGQKLRSVKYE